VNVHKIKKFVLTDKKKNYDSNIQSIPKHSLKKSNKM